MECRWIWSKGCLTFLHMFTANLNDTAELKMTKGILILLFLASVALVTTCSSGR